LVTLVGPGGVGKTSLALRVATDLVAESVFPDGVGAALLAPLGAAADLPLALAEALGLALQSDRPADAQLASALAGRRMLLLLDNLEQLLAPAEAPALTAFLLLLLERAPGLRILATARERLGLRTEQVFTLEGLDLPRPGFGQHVERADAVRLFVERARQAQPAFTLTAANRASVAQICRKLEGLPLAIELAAAWVRALSPVEIVAELDHSLDFLAGSSRDSPARHGSINAALGHSWRLLNATERDILARLSVFRGGFDRAAAAVMGAGLPALTALIDKSLLRHTLAEDVTRYTVHELVRQFAAARLAEDPTAEQETIRRHVAFYAGLLGRSINPQTGGAPPEAWAALVRDADNLRTAWARAVELADEAALQSMARPLAIFYDGRGWLREGAALFERAALALKEAGAADEVRGLVVGHHGYCLLWSGQVAAGAALLVESVELLAGAEAGGEYAFMRFNLGTVELYAGRLGEARAHYEAAARLAAEGDAFTRWWAMFFNGGVAMFSGELAVAERQFTSCLAEWRAATYQRGMASALFGLSDVALQQGRLDAAAAYAHECLKIGSTTQDQPTVGRALRALGALALARREIDEAFYLLTESCAALRAVSDYLTYGRSRGLLAQVEVRRGDLVAAWRGVGELLAIGRDISRPALAEAVYSLALVRAAEGRDEEAWAALLALEHVPGEQVTRRQAEALREELAQRLTAQQRATAWPGGTEPLHWIEALYAREPTAPQSPQPEAPGRKLPAPAGALVIAETGATLSPREVEVLRLLVAGASNAVIAQTLVISLFTVKHHVASVLGKLGVTTRVEAALRGRDLGLPPLDPRVGDA